MAVQLTESAARQVERIIREKSLSPESTALRVGAKGGGCSGFSYQIDLDAKGPTEADRVEESHGIRIVIDKKSYFYLNGMEIDFSESMLGGQFKFVNPNATGTCGCGTSFSVG